MVQQYMMNMNIITHNYKLNDDHTLFAHYSHSQMKWILILKLNFMYWNSVLEMCDDDDEVVVEVIMQVWHMIIVNYHVMAFIFK